MSLPGSARPAPGTTELLEVLDRVLDGGLVIDAGPRLNVVGFASAGVVARLMVGGSVQPHDPASGPGAAVPDPMFLGERPSAMIPKRRHG